MARVVQQRKRTFPLTLHPTRQWCKRIRGKLYYFGVDKQAAYERYLREAADLHAGRQRGISVPAGRMTIKDLANHYLAHQHERMTGRELAPIHFRDCQSILRAFVDAVGERTAVEELAPQLVHSYRTRLVKRYAPTAANRHIGAIKAMFNYGLDFGLIERGPNLRKALPKVPARRLRAFERATERANGGRIFSAA